MRLSDQIQFLPAGKNLRTLQQPLLMTVV